MRQILLFLIELLVAYFLIGHVLVRNLLPRRRKALQALKEHERYVKKLRKVHYDLLSGESCEKLKDLGSKLRRIRKSRGTTESDISEAIEETDNVCSSYVPRKYRNRSVIAEYLEIAVVALGIAFAVRGFALQPFKIPTGSMEPTMYGIHFVEKKELENPNSLEKLFGYLHYSKRYVDVTIKESGQLQSIKPASTIPFMSAVDVKIGGHTYRLPGKYDNVKEYLPDRVAKFLKKNNLYKKKKLQLMAKGEIPAPEPPSFRKGEVLARGYLVAGDHIFVDRFSWNFSEPERGDITVFITDGLSTEGGRDLNGRYYIKRLVGLPGDELKIKDGKLYLRKPGEEEFSVVDADIDPAFKRLYSGNFGYDGYTHPEKAQYLLNGEDVFKVPEGHYFMLGDNSSHSLDSRYWGTVPRRNLVGQAALVWWPFSKRWGLADHRY